MQQKCNTKTIVKNRSDHKSNAHGTSRMPSEMSVTKVKNSTQDKMEKSINNIRNDTPCIFSLSKKPMIGTNWRRSIYNYKSSFIWSPNKLSNLFVSCNLNVNPSRIFALLLLIIVMSGKINIPLLLN